MKALFHALYIAIVLHKIIRSSRLFPALSPRELTRFRD
ncbi:hypothetical protein LEP1GSC061_4037 [Leptospira wolffii serovar Khorat str. Khorat-H2]|nr:hypothetical protein LEP1GSC061_4037 [Leptospira wolffii serovar Khorat str. Khorat-H2]